MNTPLLAPARILALMCLAAFVLPSPIFGYGNEGHQTVGAVADKLIANSPNTVAHVRASNSI